MVSISQISGNFFFFGEGGGWGSSGVLKICNVVMPLTKYSILSRASFESGKYNLILENFILVIHVSNITIHIFI